MTEAEREEKKEILELMRRQGAAVAARRDKRENAGLSHSGKLGNQQSDGKGGHLPGVAVDPNDESFNDKRARKQARLDEVFAREHVLDPNMPELPVNPTDAAHHGKGGKKFEPAKETQEQNEARNEKERAARPIGEK